MVKMHNKSCTPGRASQLTSSCKEYALLSTGEAQLLTADEMCWYLGEHDVNMVTVMNVHMQSTCPASCPTLHYAKLAYRLSASTKLHCDVRAHHFHYL